MKSILKRVVVFSIVIIVALSGLFGGCFLLSDNDILAVRERADKLHRETATAFGKAFIERDEAAVKGMFCQKTQELSDLQEEIENTFSYLDGNVASYRIGERGYEGYGSEFDVVDEYEFEGNMFMTTDKGTQYNLSFHIKYITEDSIKGLNRYSLSELYKDGHCSAGYNWSTPYDGDCGKLCAKLIKHLANGEQSEIESLICGQIKQNAETRQSIAQAITAFEGNPLFIERADGLYNKSTAETDIYIHIWDIIKKNADGEIESVWLNLSVQSIKTAADKNYDLEITLFLKNASAPQREGISFFKLTDNSEKSSVSVGEWLND